MRFALFCTALERTLAAFGLFGLWFTSVQVAMLPDESRRLIWYAIAAALLLAAAAIHVLRRPHRPPNRPRRSPA